MKRDQAGGGLIHVAIFLKDGELKGILTDHPKLVQFLVVDEDAETASDDDLEFPDGLSVTDLVCRGKYIL